jgi:hypothetical protein
MDFPIQITDLGLIPKEDLLLKVLPQYGVNLDDLGIPLPRSRGMVQQYRWHFAIDRTLDVVSSYFNDEKSVNILADIGAPTLKQFELLNGCDLEVGAEGLYWIKKKLTLAKGKFIITNTGLHNDILRLGYIRLEDLRRNWSLLGMLNMSGFGFSIFQFSQAADGKTKGSYYIAQQLPGHIWGKPLIKLLRKKLNNPSFVDTFTALKRTIESS